MKAEKSLVIIKPDGVKRSLVGKIISRIEDRGYSIDNMKMMQITEELASQHYGEHKGKPFFQELVDFITSGPVVVLQISGANAVSNIRKTMGTTNPAEALPGTIRGDFGNDISANLIHGSDSVESALREISLFFGD